jgi:hypothetical protein
MKGDQPKVDLRASCKLLKAIQDRHKGKEEAAA